MSLKLYFVSIQFRIFINPSFYDLTLQYAYLFFLSISFSQLPQKERRPNSGAWLSMIRSQIVFLILIFQFTSPQANHSSRSLFILLSPRLYLAESFSFLKMHIKNNLLTMFSVSSLSRIVTFYMLLISFDTISSCFTF